MRTPTSLPWALVLILPSWLGGCATAPEAPLAFCEGPVGALYDPLGSDELQAWPDAAYTVIDDDSSTGLRITADVASTPWIATLPPLLRGLFSAVDGLGGFGRQGAVVIRFDAPIGASLAGPHPSPTLDDPVVLLQTDRVTGEATALPWEGVLDDDTRQLRVQPLRPLRSGTSHALVVTDAFRPDAGGCVVPSPVQRTLLRAAWTATLDEIDGLPDAADLQAPPEDMLPVVEGLVDLLRSTGWRADRIGHVTTFTTHDEAPALRALADDLVAQGPTWATPPACTAQTSGGLSCQGTARVVDARDADGAVRRGEQATQYEVPVRFWMDDQRGPDAPLTQYGHGMNGGASNGGGRVRDRIVGDLGHVLFATDALAHSDHPTAKGGDLEALDFLGIDLSVPVIDGNRLRGNFVQTVLDRVQVLDLVRRTPDIDGDGSVDFDPDRIGYWGVSLGGLLGPGLLALSDDVDAAVLSVGGGHLIKFALGSEQVALIQPLLVDLAGSDANLQRLLIVAQTAADPADPAVFAAHVLHDRLGPVDVGPDVLLPVSIYDNTVPPVTGRALARAFPLPHVGPVFDAVPPLPTDTALPTSANVDGTTAGYFQYDRVTDGASVVASSHDNTPFREESYAQLLHFFETWETEGHAEILDPYELLSTPPLPDSAKP